LSIANANFFYKNIFKSQIIDIVAPYIGIKCNNTS